MWTDFITVTLYVFADVNAILSYLISSLLLVNALSYLQ